MEGETPPGGLRTSVSGGLDDQAFRLIYPALHRFASVVADRDIDPDDLVQDALVGLLRAPPGHVRDPAAYLRRSVLNGVAGVRRRSAARRVTPVDPTDPLSELCAGRIDDINWPADARAVMQAVRPVDRALIYLLDVEDLPAAAVADILDQSAVAVRARASRARRAARRALANLEDPP
jgi:DNA-directed RNA polymerase specialized sigma24 family protein